MVEAQRDWNQHDITDPHLWAATGRQWRTTLNYATQVEMLRGDAWGLHLHLCVALSPTEASRLDSLLGTENSPWSSIKCPSVLAAMLARPLQRQKGFCTSLKGYHIMVILAHEEALSQLVNCVTSFCWPLQVENWKIMTLSVSQCVFTEIVFGHFHREKLSRTNTVFGPSQRCNVLN